MFSLFSSFKQLFSDNTAEVKAPVKVTTPVFEKKETLGERQARHRTNALRHVKQSHKELTQKKKQEDAWHRSFSKQKEQELRQLSGQEFEDFLAGLFHRLGYQVEMTPTSGDYGADLILSKGMDRIAVQAKCYSGSVGVSAVQEVLAGMVYYNCKSAWVITTGNLTANAIELAKKSRVKLFDSNEIGKLIKQASE